MKANSVYRAEARQSMSGKWATSALFCFVCVLLSCVVDGLLSYLSNGYGSMLASLLILPFSYALEVAFLRQFRAEEMQIEWLFEHFNRRVWVTMIYRYILVILWSLLLIIPGIIKSYSYAMVPYLVLDDPELTGREALNRSEAMMKGHRMDMFLLDLSFLGWVLLGILAFGVGVFFVSPYIESAHAAFYEDLKEE